ncbi:MAG: hypothetical protein JWN89_442 [Parcubacteria group bacterium]|nr:hypothetical protein [Parcubacteria group bacterium]
MKIVACNSVSVVKVRFEIHSLRIDGEEASIKDLDGFVVWLPRAVAIELRPGDMIHALCVPNLTLTETREVLAMSVKRGEDGVIQPVFNKGPFWAEIFNRYAFL